MHIRLRIIIFSFVCCLSTDLYTKPRLAILMIIDQFAYHYLIKLSPFFQDGIKFLMDNGIVYSNAYHPHAIPSTATGHTTFNTGVFAKDHGIVDNAWFDAQGNTIKSDDDSSEQATVFSPTGTYNYGRSAANIMVDGISDQIMLASSAHKKNKVIALSLKSRAAIGLAGHLGKAIWFDTATGSFTSSKAYYNKLPRWLIHFNRALKKSLPKTFEWQPVFPHNSPAYAFRNIHDYTYAQMPTLINQTISIPQEQSDEKYAPLERNPLGNQILFDLATTYIENNIHDKNNNIICVWISLSSLDLIGHAFGPESMETIDMLYHLDKQIKQFMTTIEEIAGPDTLYLLSSDHGIAPIPEVIESRGIPAQRIYGAELIPQMNDLIEKKVGISNLVQSFQPNFFYFDTTIFDTLQKKDATKAIALIKDFLRKQPGIRNVWDYQELAIASFHPDQIEQLYQNLLYPERAGDIIFETLPYYQATMYKDGTAHVSPYETDTHVPLIMYQKGMQEHKTIHTTVYATQVANTLAALLHVEKPSSSTAQPLPGITYPKLSGLEEEIAKSRDLQKMHQSLVPDPKKYGAEY